MWILYWISYLLPVTFRHLSPDYGWFAAQVAAINAFGIFQPENWDEAMSEILFSLAYTISNLCMLFIYFFVRAKPRRMQSLLFVCMGLINLTAPWNFNETPHVAFYVWVASFFLMALALSKPGGGRPLQFNLATLFVGMLVGIACGVPISEYPTPDNAPEVRAVVIAGIVLFIFMPATVLARDWWTQRKIRGS